VNGPDAIKDGRMRASRTLPTLTTGVLVGVVMVVFSTSFAAFVFSGDLAVHLPAAIGLVLVGNALVMVVIAAFSSLPGTIAGVHPTTVPIAAAMAAGIATDLPGASQRTFLTVVLTISLATLLAGGFFFVLGSLELGNLVRFVPYPVVGGFLAGTGWLLAKGAIEVLSGVRLSVSDLSELGRSEVAAKWVSGVVFGVLLYLAVRRYRHYLTLPALLLAGAIAFYLCVVVTGHTVGEAESEGWLIGPFPSQEGWEPWAARALGSADWSAVLSQAPGMATLIAVGVLALLLNVSGIELGTGRDADLNRELRSAGIANVAAGAGGGMAGFHGVILTVLAHRTGVSNRFVGVIAGVVSAAALLAGTSTLGMLPRPLLGGLLLFLGLGFLVEWAYDSRRRLPAAEYAIVWVILLIIAAVGLLEGVAAGLLIAAVLFIVDYSHTDVVKHALSGATYQSRVERAPAERDLLRHEGQRLEILRLQGFIFFGSANALLERVRARATSPDQPTLSSLVLDFRAVTGLDSSAVLSFSRIQRLGKADGFPIVLTGLSSSIRRSLERGGIAGQDGSWQVFADMDRGVQWCEDRCLEAHRDAAQGHQPDLTEVLDDQLDAAVLMPYLERKELPARACVVRQGEAADDVFFVESGRLTATLAVEGTEPVQLRVMGPGTVVGEVALYNGAARTASVFTDTPCVVFRLSRYALVDMERRDPHLASALHALFAHRLAERLTDLTETVKILRD
jgi:SulP family sulfate permease